MVPADQNNQTSTGIGSTAGTTGSTGAAGGATGTGMGPGGTVGTADTGMGAGGALGTGGLGSAGGTTSTTLGTSGMEPATPAVGATGGMAGAGTSSGMSGMGSAGATGGMGNGSGGAATSRVREQAMKLRGQATEKARGAAEQGKERVASQVGSIAQAIHQAAGTLEEQAGPPAAQYVHRAADMLDQVAASLRNRSVDELLDDARTLARQNPTAAIGAAFVVGFAMSRFLKATAPENDMSAGMGGGVADQARPPAVGNGSSQMTLNA